VEYHIVYVRLSPGSVSDEIPHTNAGVVLVIIPDGEVRAKAAGAGLKTQITVAKAIKRRIKIDDTIVLSELAKRMGIKANEMIIKLMGLGVMATVNQVIDFETAVLVAAEFEYELERATFEEELILKVETDDPESLEERPPVVTIMGHVDHGKTSLLDVIRKTNVTDGEAGGITQHIGAYNVSTDKGRIAFLDTPGHEAFTAMRSRGAKVTDLVVLVVAADDGVMPQTVEAINHSKAAEVPIIVAINKIDKDNADPERVKRELADVGLTPEDWGGDTIFLNVSAKQETGIDELLEMILLQSEILELKANPNKPAFGHVVEARLDSGMGPVATVLIQEGTLNAGDIVVCGSHYGKIRALRNDKGDIIEKAGPSVPVEIIGLSGVPNAGDEMVVLAGDKDAKQVSANRLQKQRSKELDKTSRLSLESLFEKMQEGEVKDLNMILKADVHGSIEAISESLTKLSNEEVKISIIHSATGTVTESDVPLAAVSNAIIIGFNVRPNATVQSLANEENVDMRFYTVIYDLIKDVRDAILGMMASTYEEVVMGRAEIREIFHVPKIGSIAGSYVTDGKIQRGKLVRLLRDGVIVYDGNLGSLRRFKDDVKEVQTGYECGIGIENYNDIKQGDTIECYYLEEIKPVMD
jgi:translation initiation factor IF-2